MMTLKPFLAGWPLAAACSFIPLLAAAQTQTVVITGNPLGGDSLVQPSSVLTGENLAQRRAGTLGETLADLPGVTSTRFGPNSSRPVIRGLDGDRIRLLDNGGASVDASSLSFDHASATDPLVAERIEVLRGPAALLYGGNAVGGVVNSVDNRIPRLGMSGLGGRAEVRLGGAASERSGAAVVEGGGGALAWHADVQARRAGDLRVPRFTPVEDGTPLDPATRVRNSAAEAEGGAVGASWVRGDSYAGASVETARQRYGVTVEPDVTIRMKRDRLALAGQWALGSGFINQVTAQGSHTRYQHEEVEGDGAVGTTFSSRGQEARVQARHRSVTLWGGELQGAWGAQVDKLRFSALGEEAFVPGTDTRSSALFALEEWRVGAFTFSLGGRAESVRVASDGDLDSAAPPRFGAAASRSFAPRSTALALKVVPAAGWKLTSSVAWTQRAPTYYELYANGLHLATAAFERGDSNLGVERNRHLELGLAWAAPTVGFSAQVFKTDFARYISLDATGQTITIPGEPGEPDVDVPEYLFRAARARLTGAEIEGHAQIFKSQQFTLEARASADMVRGTDLDGAQALARLSPWRARVALVAKAAQWRAGVEVRHHATQDRVPVTDTATPGFTMVDLWAGATLPVPGAPQLLLKLGNATNELATSASTIATIRGLSPLPGRALSLVLRAAF